MEIFERTVFGIVFIALMLLGILWYPPLFPVLCIFVMCGAMSEFFNMAMGSDIYRTERVIALLTMVTLFATITLSAAEWLPYGSIAFTILPLTALMLSPVFRKGKKPLVNMAYIFVAIVYIGLPVALTPFLVYKDGTYDGHLLMALFITIWSTDVGAYLLGSTLGQRKGARKLAPSISPKKSLWGCVGAAVTGTIAALILRHFGWIELGVIETVGLGVLVSFAAVAGDLVESMWKRHFGVKDSGHLIPGHGGLYDRFDSALVAIPVAAVYISLF